ncbi:MAG TPA: DUF4249 domain-containing protein [Flavitalea sp.]|nr:DUF4249 domain-containing protein [Flavitalea sp.]
MRLIIVSLMLSLFYSCDKAIDVDLPEYQQELVMEMYLEQGRPLRCLLIESLPYTDTAINKPVNDALIIFSDGTKNDTLTYRINQDMVTGRFYNYYHPRVIEPDPNKIYSITIIGNEKKITSTTRFSQTKATVDSLIVRESMNEPDSFSVGIKFTDPASVENYYRILIGKNINLFSSDPTDFRISDISFDGKPFSYYSEPNFARNDTIAARVYSLNKEHYEYLESMGNARRSNFNPFSQPGRIKSNVSGGLGIFTSILYTEHKVIIR